MKTCLAAVFAAASSTEVPRFRNPENSIPFAAAGKLLQVGAMRTGCAHFGLLLGQRSDTRSLGLVGDLMRNAPTLGRALQDLVENLHRYVRGGVWYLAVRRGVAFIGYAIHQPGTEGVDHFYDGRWRSHSTNPRTVRSVAGRSAPGAEAATRCPSVSPSLSGPVRFDAEQTALVFPAGQLERPVPRADSRQRAILEELVAKYWAVTLPSVADQVVRLLRPRVLFGDFAEETIARRLTMHPRALNRRLKAEGTTFRKLLNEVRFEVAGQLLLGTRMGVTEIASALGYADTSAFSHAFSRMAGTPPHAWRVSG